jgi:hypothetical protein
MCFDPPFISFPLGLMNQHSESRSTACMRENVRHKWLILNRFANEPCRDSDFANHDGAQKL